MAFSRDAADDSALRERQFRDIYARHYAVLLGYVLRRILNRADAEELVNTVFRIAWQRIERIPDEPDTRKWLLWVARRTISNHVRSGRRWQRLLQRISLLHVQIDSGAALPDTEGDDVPVRRAFNALRDSEKEVLRLIAWDGMSHAEAAQILGCSVSTFDVRLHRARAALRSALELETSAMNESTRRPEDPPTAPESSGDLDPHGLPRGGGLNDV